MGTKVKSLAHTKWLCKYHIVFAPKYRRKIIFAQIRKNIGEILRDLCKYKGVEIIEGHLMPDLMCTCLWVFRRKSVYRVLWGTWKVKAHWWFLISTPTLNISSATESFGQRDTMWVQLAWMKQQSKSTYSIRKNMTLSKTSWPHESMRTPLRGSQGDKGTGLEQSESQRHLGAGR